MHSRAKKPASPEPKQPAGAARQHTAAAQPALWTRAVGPLSLQAKLTVNQAGDAFEQEADQAAAQVMRTPAPAPDGMRRCACGGIADETGECPACRAQRLALQRKGDPMGGMEAPESVHAALRNPGAPLEEDMRSFMEARFGQDFGSVRVHTGDQAAQSAADVSARAYTVGQDIVFGQGQYAPGSDGSKHLLAHELAHVVQQGGSSALHTAADEAAHGQLQRAEFTVGTETIHVDFGGLDAVANADLVSAIESRFIAYTSAADATAIHGALTGLGVTQQRWVLYALDLLRDNTRAPDHARLNRIEAVQRLIAHARGTTSSFTSDPLGVPEEEALRASGWFEIALVSAISAPTAADTLLIDDILNPTPSGGAGAALRVAQFHRRMRRAVRHLIDHLDPAHWAATGTHNLATLRVIGDELMDEAKVFFAPYAHTSRATVFGLNPPFHISANIFSVTALTPTADQRRGYLRNRATIVGRNTATTPAFNDTNVFDEVNFDGARPADRAELERLITRLLADTNLADAVDRLLQHTGRQSGSGTGTRIGLSTEYNADALSECQARWRVIATLCHEIMHALAHPDFELHSQRVGFGQVLLEGVPEVLGVQMFNRHVKPKATSDAAFKGRMETGLSSAPCATPPDIPIGYGAAGTRAEQIRSMASVGDDNFRAAFFLGQIHLLGQ